MTANQLEELHQRVRGSWPHVQVLYLWGRTARELALRTTDGQPFESDEMYCFSEAGIWKVDP